MYGEGQNSRYAGVITKFAERLSKGLPPIIYGDGKQTRDFVSVNDVVDAIMLAMQSDVSDTFNVGTGRTITINELALNMTEIFEIDLKPEYQKASQGEIIQSCASTIRSKDVLKFVATRELIKWFKIIYASYQ